MQEKNRTCHGHWKLWLTEIPHFDCTSEDLSLLPCGEALWSTEWRYVRVHLTKAHWRIDDAGRLLLLAHSGRVLSRCDMELAGDLMTLRPAHGHRSLYERVAGPVSPANP